MFLGHFAVGLWYSVAATLGVELTIFGAALMLFVRGAPEVARRRSFVLLIAVLLIGYAAAAIGPPPPDVNTLAWSALSVWIRILWAKYSDNSRRPPTADCRLPTDMRRILHIDMDAFYASVEQRDDPALRGKPVAVGGDPTQRGVVAAASYEARAFGVRSAMPMARAVRLCPALVIVRPDFARYRAASRTVFDIFRSVTPLVEPLSLDEAYLDVTENAWNEPLGRIVAQRLKATIREATQLSASAGVAPNKFLAKIASAWKKPDGLTVIAPARVEQFLQQLPVDALWGVGPVTAKRLHERGIQRLVDLRSVDPGVLREVVGSYAEWLRGLADGIDNRPVVPDRVVKSSGSENTFATDLTALGEIRRAIDEMARDAAAWLMRRSLVCRTVTIKVRYSDFTTVTRSDTRLPATSNADALATRAVALLDRTQAGERPVRLLGVSVHNLTDPSEPAPEPVLPFADDSGSYSSG